MSDHTTRHKSITIEDAFWSYATPGAPDSCWEWPGCTYSNGYGVLRFRNKQYYTHRLSYELHRGSIPDAMFICHTCDNPPCWNPDHLFVGTHSDNMQDMLSKGRDKHRRGEDSKQAKLTNVAVRSIRKMYADGERFDDIAEEFQVSHQTLRDVIRGERWAHVDPDYEYVPRGRLDKLTAQDVIKVRQLRQQGLLLKDIATEYGVAVSAISRIVSRKAWGHVE